MKRKISEVQSLPGYTRAESALFIYNDINEPTQNIFPELYKDYTFREYLECMTPLSNTDKFIEEIKNHNKLEEICVFGDYDVDGIMATTIMCHALAVLGYNIHYSIPNRLTDGYGKQNISEDIKYYNSKLAITVDNGVSARNFVEEAKSLGVKVIVTDHHLAEAGNEPDCLIIDPAYNNDPFPGVCGAVVALKLMYALYKEVAPNKLSVIEGLTPFAGVATIADMMPVIGENRIIIRTTLDELNRTKECNIRNPFQKAMFALGGYGFYNDPDAVATEELIGFTIGPVINAVSRVSGQVAEVVDALLETLQSSTFRIKSFTSYNITRKKMTDDLLENYKYDKTYKNSSVFVYDENNFYYSIKGIIGLIANKVSKTQNVVTLIGHKNDLSETIDFSGRSVPGYNLNEGIQRIKEAHPEFEITGGGHASALGIKIKNDPDVLEKFRKELDLDVEKYSEPFEDIIWEFESDYCDEIVETLFRYQPYGEAFQKLKFTYKGKFKSFDNDNKYAEIGDFLFKMYVSVYDISSYLNKEVEVDFTISFDKKSQVEFKATLKK